MSHQEFVAATGLPAVCRFPDARSLPSGFRDHHKAAAWFSTSEATVIVQLRLTMKAFRKREKD